MRILTVTNCPLDLTLGSGKTVLMFTAGLRAAGHTVDVLEPADYEPAHLWTQRARKFRRARWAAHAVARKMATGYDLVEFYGDDFWLAARTLHAARPRPVLVAHTNGLELLAHAREAAHRPPGVLRKWLDRATHLRFSRVWLRSVDALVCLCGADARWAVEQGLLAADRVTVVEPGLDTPYRAGPVTPASSRGPRVGYSGSWIDRKGVDQLVRVMDRVLALRPDVRFDVFGTSRCPAEQVRGAFAEAIRDRVIVHPKMSTQELADGLGRIGVYVFPSRYEGYGLALAEAMARGCAVVTTPTGLGADLTDGRDGRVVGFDDTGGLEAAVLQLLDDPVAQDRVAVAGRQRVVELDWHAAGRRLADLYQSFGTAS